MHVMCMLCVCVLSTYNSMHACCMKKNEKKLCLLKTHTLYSTSTYTISSVIGKTDIMTFIEWDMSVEINYPFFPACLPFSMPSCLPAFLPSCLPFILSEFPSFTSFGVCIESQDERAIQTSTTSVRPRAFL